MILLYPDYSESNAKYLADILDIEAIKIHTRIFPNREVLIRLDEADPVKLSEQIIIYFPTYPDTNDRVIALFETLDTINYYNSKASKTLILP
jgi:phosphoribosylpyrophosphate synthetase